MKKISDFVSSSTKCISDAVSSLCTGTSVLFGQSKVSMKREYNSSIRRLSDQLDSHMQIIGCLRKIMNQSTMVLNQRNHLIQNIQRKNSSPFRLTDAKYRNNFKRAISEAMSERTLEMHTALHILIQTYPLTHTPQTLLEADSLYNERSEHMQRIEEISQLIFDDAKLRLAISNKSVNNTKGVTL